jgi:hypothetical protein
LVGYPEIASHDLSRTQVAQQITTVTATTLQEKGFFLRSALWAVAALVALSAVFAEVNYLSCSQQ